MGFSKKRNLNSLDILTSALNEDENIVELYKRLRVALLPYPKLKWKLHVVDNGSSDKTWLSIVELSTQDNRVIGYRMSRTFLFDAAITAVLDHATADAVVIMCSDLQDPPELIPNMIDFFESGAEHVCVRITSRKSSPVAIRILTRLFYRLANSLTQGGIPENVSDFRLASRKCYEAARKLRESNRFIRGQFAWVGFNPQYLDIDRPPRRAGISKFLQFPKWNAIWLALSAIFSHSSIPLLLIATVGLLSSLLSFLVTIAFSLLWLFFGVPFAGFGTIVGVIVFGFSILFLALGIMAIYLASIYEEVKNRPLYILAEKTD